MIHSGSSFGTAGLSGSRLQQDAGKWPPRNGRVRWKLQENADFDGLCCQLDECLNLAGSELFPGCAGRRRDRKWGAAPILIRRRPTPRTTDGVAKRQDGCPIVVSRVGAHCQPLQVGNIQRQAPWSLSLANKEGRQSPAANVAQLADLFIG